MGFSGCRGGGRGGEGAESRTLTTQGEAYEGLA